MERLKDYECPPDCSKRSKTCHSECERHQKYREIAEEIRVEKYKSRYRESLTNNKPFLKKKH